ncbi:hypothetical protein OHA72_57130 [Dactylosporangium sp. NBC_01737]|uniref:hypothetical protein n=1 Tax=Dactylosporangium sp. NBC_01737 TaxID=2975959 RepID=UPI002E0E9978|nr:hypothetical protein OHA72_57130 [Dactylosporangium sp. NBC_01737]
MRSVIRTWGLTKQYGRRPALVDLDLDVPPNVVFGYLGPTARVRPRRSGCWPV